MKRRHLLFRMTTLMLIAAIVGGILGQTVFGSDDDILRIANETGTPHTSEPGAAHSAADSNHMHSGMKTAPVASIMAADHESVAFCVSASLEPFDGAMAQLRESGPAEAAERMRSCVFDTMIGHGDDATMADLDSHVSHFASCFGELQFTAPADKRSASGLASACIVSEFPSP